MTGSDQGRPAKVSSEPPVPTGSVNITVLVNPSSPSGAPVLDLNSLGFADASTFIQALAEGDVIEVPAPGAAGIEDLSINATFEVDATTGTVTFVGVSELTTGSSSALMLTAIWGASASPDIVIGVSAQSFSLSDIGFSGPFSSHIFPDSVFLISDLAPGNTLSVSSTALSPAAQAFLEDAYPGTGGFSLELVNGVNFASALPLSSLPAPLLELTGANPLSEVLLEGSAGLDFGLLTGASGAVLTDLSIVAMLPPFAPALLPNWIEPSGPDPQITFTYDGTSTALTVTGGFAVDADGTPLSFEVLSELDLSSTEGDFELVANMTSPWANPFGVPWLTLDTAQLKVNSLSGGGFAAAVHAGLDIGTAPDTATLDLVVSVTGTPGSLDAEITATSSEVISTGDLLDFIASEVGVTLPPGIPALELNDVTISVAAGSAGTALSISATAQFLGVEASVLFSVKDPDGAGPGEPELVHGINLPAIQLSDFGVSFPGSIGSFEFPELAFVVADVGPAAPGEDGRGIPSSELSPAEISFFNGAYGIPDGLPSPPDFTINLRPGLNLAGSFPISVLPTAVHEAIGSPAGDVILEGSIVLDIGIGTNPSVDLVSLGLKAQLPGGVTIPGLPDWFTPATGLAIEVGYDASGPSPEVRLGVSADFNATLDAQTLVFDLSLQLVSGDDASVEIRGGTDDTWGQPFGVTWLTLTSIDVLLSADGSGGYNATLSSSFLIGAKSFSLTFDVTGSAGALDAEITATSSEVLSTGDLLDFIASEVGVTLPPGIPALELDDVTISVGAGSAGTALSISATAQFLGVEAAVLFSVKDPDGTGPAQPELIYGINLPSTKLSQLGVSFPGSLGSFSFPELAFVVAEAGPAAPGEDGHSVSSQELSAAELSFFNGAYGIPDGLPSPPDFTINLQPGLNLAGSFPISALPTAVYEAIGSPAGDVILEGSIVLDIGIGTNPSVDLISLGLKAQLPGGVTIPGLPDWFTPATGLAIEVGYDASGPSPEVRLGVSADFNATLDAQTLVFDLSLQLVSGDDASVEIRGGTDDTWGQPFGVTWLTLTSIDVLLSADGSGNFNALLGSSFDIGSKTFSLTFEVTGSSGSLDAEITATASSLSTGDVLALLNTAGINTGGLSLPDMTVTNLQVSIVGGTSGIGFSLGGATNVLGKPAQLLISVIGKSGPGGLTPQVIAGIQMSDFSMGDLVPSLDGTLAGDFSLGSLALAVSIGDGEFASDDLPLPVFSFYRQVYGTDDFTLNVSSGISLIASIPLPEDGIGAALDALGSGGQPVLLSGTIPAPWGGGGLGVSLRAELPPMSPTLPDGSSPPWFQSGQLSLFIEVGTTGVSIGIEGALSVIIDESAITGVPNDKTPLTFFVSAEFTGTPTSIAFTLKGGLTTGPDTPWESPFGIEWLTIRGLSVGLSFNLATLGLGLGLTGDADIGGKNLEVAISLSLNVATGVPTNFVFRGASNTSFGMSDLVVLAEHIADSPGSIPSDSIPDIELRPIDSQKPIEVKFAVFNDPITDTPAGLALSGALYATLSPGGPLEEVAVVDVKIGIGDPFGIFIFGSIPQDITVGAITLGHPLIDIDLAVFPPAARFLLQGDLTTPWFEQRVDIELDSDVLLADALQTLAEVQAKWELFVTAFEEDPVAAIETVLIGPGGIFDILGVPPPPWVSDLFDAVQQAQALSGSVSKDQLLEYALNGFDITIPPFQGYPAGGVPDLGCRLLETEHTDGRCYTVLPFPGVEQGFDLVLVCDFGIPEAGECWIVPPSATTSTNPVPGCSFGILEAGECWLVTPSSLFSTSKVTVTSTSLHCHEWWGPICTDLHTHTHTTQRCPVTHPFEFRGLCYSPSAPVLSGGSPTQVCPFGYVMSNGTCYTVIPGPPVKTSGTPHLEQRCLFPGQIENGKCWEFGKTPHPGFPAGGNNPACPLINPFYASGRCWTVPPLPEPYTLHFAGVCGALGIACNLDQLRDVTFGDLVAGAVEALAAPFKSEEVETSPPDAHAGGPYTVAEGGSVSLNAAGSSDPDGDALTYAWDLDGDGQFDDATGVSPQFSAAGADGPSTLTVRVRVSDGDLTDTDTASVSITNVAPTITISGPAAVTEGDTFVLQLASSDPGPDTISSWHIEWGDGTVSTVSGNPSTATHVYGGAQAPTISATATDEDGTYSSNSVDVTVINAAPTVTAAGATVDEGGTATVGGSVSDPGSSDALKVSIDWGDGTTPTVLNLPAGATTYSATHIYFDDEPTGTPSDEYTVSVTVADVAGETGTATATVTVVNVAPSVTVADSQATEGSTASITGTLQDPGPLDTFEVSIDWGDGSAPSTVILPAGATTYNAIHQYLNDGVYPVSVTAVDDDTGAGSANASVIVVNVAPALQEPLATPDDIDEGQAATVTGIFTDPGVLDTFTVEIHWGDGETTVLLLPAGADSYQASHQYPDDDPTGTDSDNYAITVSVTDDGGGGGSSSAAVVVSNVAPVVTATGDVITENGIATVAGTITDPGVQDTFTVNIDWGEGDVEVLELPAGSTTYTASHQYTDDNPSGTVADDYPVVVTVVDDDGGTGVAEATVTVQNVAPVVDAGPDQAADEGDVVSLAPATFTDAGTADTHTATIDWGDGTRVAAGTVGSGAVSGSHAYADNGLYTVTVCVTDDDLAQTCDVLAVTVQNVAPVVDAGPDQAADEGDVVSLAPATFTDAGTADTHTAAIDWGDGTPVEAGTVGSGAVSGSHVYADNGLYTVTVCVTDDDLAETCDVLAVTVQNVAPLVDAGPDQAADEGDVVSLAPATFTDAGAADTHTATIDWGDGTPVEAGTVAESDGSGNVSGSHVYADNGTYTVTVCVTDDDLAQTCDELAVTVQNVAPVVTVNGDVIVENGTATVAGSIADPGAGDTFTVTIDWGEGGPETLELPAGSTAYTASHQYLDDNPSGTAADNYSVVVTVADDDGGAGAGSALVTVNNAAPIIGAVSLAPSLINEGDQTTIEVHFTDAGSQDTHSATIDWGDGTVETFTGIASPFLASHLYVDDNVSDVYTVSVLIQDDDTGEASANASVTVRNVDPVLGAVIAPGEPVPVGISITTQASFTDLGLVDTHTGTIDWGDGTSSNGAVDYVGLGSGAVSGAHTYLSAGVYVVTLTLTDDDGGTDHSYFQYVVVYDPSAGFVTGGGWTVPGVAGNSDLDDSLPDLDGVSKSNFGFNIKYKKDDPSPEGQLQFTYHGGDFNLHASEFQWLVVADGVAQFQGTATIEGLDGEFTVRVTVEDNGNQSDRLVIRIWAEGANPNVDAPLYKASGTLGGGQIKVHG